MLLWLLSPLQLFLNNQDMINENGAFVARKLAFLMVEAEEKLFLPWDLIFDTYFM